MHTLTNYMGYIDPATNKPVIVEFNAKTFSTLPTGTRVNLLSQTPESALKTYLFILKQLKYSKWNK